MSEKEIYTALGSLTKDKAAWKESVPYVASLLDGQSLKITAKALWLLGEMGLQHPDEIAPAVSRIASFLDAQDSLLRERATNALGRIGRARFEAVLPYWDKLMRLAADDAPQVRLAFIWASENIATNTPEAYESCMPVYAGLLRDKDDKVRMEAPEMFRVMGKRRPETVRPFLEILQSLAENDPNPVVRIHSAGAIRITTGRMQQAS